MGYNWDKTHTFCIFIQWFLTEVLSQFSIELLESQIIDNIDICISYSVVCLLMDVNSRRDCMVVQFITAYVISEYHH